MYKNVYFVAIVCSSIHFSTTQAYQFFRNQWYDAVLAVSAIVQQIVHLVTKHASHGIIKLHIFAALVYLVSSV